VLVGSGASDGSAAQILGNLITISLGPGASREGWDSIGLVGSKVSDGSAGQILGKLRLGDASREGQESIGLVGSGISVMVCAAPPKSWPEAGVRVDVSHLGGKLGAESPRLAGQNWPNFGPDFVVVLLSCRKTSGPNSREITTRKRVSVGVGIGLVKS